MPATMTRKSKKSAARPKRSASSKPSIDPQKLEDFLHKVVGDFGASVSTALCLIGDKLGLYKAMAESGPVSSVELAKRTRTTERYVREWLINQAAGGYINYDSRTGKYSLPPEHAIALADENSPFFVAGGFQCISAMMKAQPRIMKAFQNGGGMRWGEHDPDLFEGTERFFRPSYVGHLVNEWIPSLDGVEARLNEGITVADVGCGHGASTHIMAKAFPNSQFFGFDNHEPSVRRANRIAKSEGLKNVRFLVASAENYQPPKGKKFDFITFFDCLHDMGHPDRAAKHAYKTLDKNGTVMIVEPMAGEHVEENFNPVGRVFSGASVLCCTANAIACGGEALGTIATDAAIAKQVKAGGFKRFRRATQTPFNRVFEARPQERKK